MSEASGVRREAMGTTQEPVLRCFVTFVYFMFFVAKKTYYNATSNKLRK